MPNPNTRAPARCVNTLNSNTMHLLDSAIADCHQLALALQALACAADYMESDGLSAVLDVCAEKLCNTAEAMAHELLDVLVPDAPVSINSNHNNNKQERYDA